MSAISLAKEFIAKTLEKKELEAQVKVAGQQLKVLEELVIDGFSDEEISNIKIGGVMVYIAKQKWASPVNGKDSMPALVEKMREHGHDELVETSIGRKKLSAFVRGEEDEGRELPSDLTEVIKVAEVYKVKVRNA